MPLPTNAKARKDVPIYRGFVKYFPDAMAEVAELSRIGNEQHNPGQPLHWAKEKSTDEADALMRHQMEVGTRDTDGVRHATKVAWRAMAQLQRELDAEQEADEWFAAVDVDVDVAEDEPLSLVQEREASKARVAHALAAGEKRDPEMNCGYATCAVCNTTGVGTATEAEVDQFMDLLRGVLGDNIGIEVIRLA